MWNDLKIWVKANMPKRAMDSERSITFTALLEKMERLEYIRLAANQPKDVS